MWCTSSSALSLALSKASRGYGKRQPEMAKNDPTHVVINELRPASLQGSQPAESGKWKLSSPGFKNNIHQPMKFEIATIFVAAFKFKIIRVDMNKTPSATPTQSAYHGASSVTLLGKKKWRIQVWMTATMSPRRHPKQLAKHSPRLRLTLNMKKVTTETLYMPDPCSLSSQSNIPCGIRNGKPKNNKPTEERTESSASKANAGFASARNKRRIARR
mmetsp:Transcript_60684/g.175663  ORF Transcript_60684/g.175663 Transcript_60684/m.175663 type:complete len:216 (-) Transcript_60684:130-777(-)